MSSGLRLDTSPWSTTTASSTQSAPAFFRSVRTDGHEVMRRPRTTPASMRVHGPWQITATGLRASKNGFTKASAFRSIRS